MSTSKSLAAANVRRRGAFGRIESYENEAICLGCSHHVGGCVVRRGSSGKRLPGLAVGRTCDAEILAGDQPGPTSGDLYPCRLSRRGPQLPLREPTANGATALAIPHQGATTGAR